jgi:hypothetical protein
VDGIRGHEDNMCAAKKTLNKIWCKVSREYIKFPTFTKYQKTKKESSLGCNEYSNQQKTEYVLKIAAAWRIFSPLTHVRICCRFLSI